MLSSGHNSDYSDHDSGDDCRRILARLSERASGIWCLIDIQSQTVSMVSQAFRHFWNLTLDAPVELCGGHSELDVGRAQLSPAWEKWLPPLPQLIAQAVELPLNHGQSQSIGNMVHCEDVGDVGTHRGRLLTIEPAGVFCITPDHSDLIARVNSRLLLLSDREAEVLDLVCDGLTNAAIARRLGISHKTVEKHRASIMTKLQVRSIAELVRGITLAQLAVG